MRAKHLAQHALLINCVALYIIVSEKDPQFLLVALHADNIIHKLRAEHFSLECLCIDQAVLPLCEEEHFVFFESL